MKRILLLTHGSFASGIKSSLKLIYGDVSNIDIIELSELSITKDLMKDLECWINLYENNIKIICTDISIGTTTKCAIPFSDRTYIVSGINLPLLLAIVLEKFDETTVEKRIDELINESKETIVNINRQIECVMKEGKEGDEYD